MESLSNVIDINNIPLAIAFTKRNVDKKLIIESANQKFYDLFGYKQPELEGVMAEILIPAESRNKHDNFVDEYLDSSTIPKPLGIGRDVQCVKKDGTLIPVEVGLYPYKEGVLVLMIDILVRTSKETMKEIKALRDSLDRVLNNQSENQMSPIPVVVTNLPLPTKPEIPEKTP